MSGSRTIFLNVIAVCFIAGSLFDITLDREHWPFSQYAMFSGAGRSSTVRGLRLFGVTTDGTEFPLDSNKYVAPFDQSRLSRALRQMIDEPDGADRARTAVAGCLARYEVLRAEGRHGGPPLAAMRLYELEWTIDPAAANVDTPDRKTFITEVRR